MSTEKPRFRLRGVTEKPLWVSLPGQCIFEEDFRLREHYLMADRRSCPVCGQTVKVRGGVLDAEVVL